MSGKWNFRNKPTLGVRPAGVSIQLVSPASGEKITAVEISLNPFVSIQLVPPASGELSRWIDENFEPCERFHSISFPSEWGASQSVPTAKS